MLAFVHCGRAVRTHGDATSDGISWDAFFSPTEGKNRSTGHTTPHRAAWFGGPGCSALLAHFVKTGDIAIVTNSAEPFRELLVRIEGEYREMPGLNLTVTQAERLWGLDRHTCACVLTTLLERRVLKRTMSGTYLRGSSG